MEMTLMPSMESKALAVQDTLIQQADALHKFYAEHKSISELSKDGVAIEGLENFAIKHSKTGQDSKRIISFIENECVLTGDQRGVRAWLMPFWKDIISDIYDDVTENGDRYVRDAVISIGRKCSKTTTIAWLVTAHMVFDQNIDIFVVSRSKEQARILFDFVKVQLECNPNLGKLIKNPSTKNSKTSLESARLELVNRKKRNRLRIGSSLGDTLHGFNPSIVILDEGHAIKDGGALYEAFATGNHLRKNALIIQISSAGHDRSTFFYQQYLKAVSHLDGSKPQMRFYAKIYGLKEKEDYRDPRNWVKAVPSLGYSFSLVDCATKYETLPARSFRTLYLNQWHQGEDEGWVITPDSWNLLADSTLKIEDFAGEPCVCGYDHATGRFDTPALVVMFRRGDKRYVFPFVWISKNTLESRIKNENAAYDDWRQAGQVILSGDDAIVEDDILNFLIQLNNVSPIKKLNFDAQFRMFSLGQSFDKTFGDAVIMAQDPRAFKMRPHFDRLETMVSTNLICHSGAGIMSWQIGNVKMEAIDRLGNLLPSKKKSKLRIDLVMALSYAVASEDVEDSSTGTMGEDFADSPPDKDMSGGLW